MTNSVTVFNYEDNKLDVIMIEGEPWFIGKQVGDILGYGNVRDAINSKVDEDDKQTINLSSVGKHDGTSGNPNVTVINESGLYSLILSSRLESAKKFKKWVTSEILPSIRKTGGYNVKPQPQINFQPQDNYNRALLSAGQSAQILTQMFKVPEGIAMAHALNRVENDYGIDFQDVKKLLPSVKMEEVDTLTPTDIAKELTNHYNTKYSARQVNTILSDMEFQIKTVDGWVVTDSGKEYGAMYPYERNNHTGYQLRWNKSIMAKVIDYLDKVN